ncbi:MAG: hypothetical protein AAF547_10780 [Actinomycetota bacterium]
MSGTHDAGSRQALPEGPRLYGRALRFVLVELIGQRGTMTVAEMTAEVASAGYPVEGRLSKVISDALRWEVARGRVTRLRRGVYRIGQAPASTARRIRVFARACRAWILAQSAGESPPSTPRDPRRYPWWPPEDPLREPWQNTAWIWSR